MKKILLLTSCILILIGCGNPTSAKDQETEITTVAETQTQEIETETESLKRENTDFRNSCWGDDIETVMKYETAKLVQDGKSDDALLYEDTINGHNTYVIYSFKDNKLYGSIYGINENYSNAGQYIPVYDSLKNTLIEIYGEPIEDEILPLTNQDQIDYSGAANSLNFGYVAYRAKWKTETTDIMIGMQAQNYEVGLIIQYQDVNYKEDVGGSGL